MPKALCNGINVHYVVKGEGPDVILAHGITSSLAVWYNQVMPALSKEFRVTMYDLRGHGYTDLTEKGYDSHNMTLDLLGLMDHLKIDRAHIVGHSYGGVIGLHLAALYPQRVNSVSISDTGIACLRHLRVIKDWPGWDLFKDQLTQHNISYEKYTDDPERIFRRSMLIPRQFGMRKGESRSTERMSKLLDTTQMVKEFREIAGLTEEVIATIQAPVLALYGAQSPYRDIVLRLKELLPHCHWDVMTGTGHFLLLQNPDVFVEREAAFLRDPMGFIAANRKAEPAAADAVQQLPA